MIINACTLTRGIKLNPCNIFNPAGISNIYLIPALNIDETKYQINLGGHGIITSMSASTDFYEIEILPETAFSEQKIVKDEKTGALYYEQNITFNLARANVFTQLFLTQLINTNQMVAIIKLNSGVQWFLYGKQNYLRVFDPTSISSGTALGDFHGLTISLQGKEPVPAFGISPFAFSVSSLKYPD